MREVPRPEDRPEKPHLSEPPRPAPEGRPVVPPAVPPSPGATPSSIEMLIFHPGSGGARADRPGLAGDPVPDRPAPPEPSAVSVPEPPRVEARRIPRQQERADPVVPTVGEAGLFGLRRLLRHDELESQGLDVAARPQRSYRLRFSSAGWIRPEYHAVVLRSAARTGGELRTYGLGVMFPPYTVHARNSTPSGAGDNCDLTQVDHVHVRRADVARDDALRSGPVRSILTRAEPGGDNSGVARDLRAALGGHVERRLRAGCVASVRESGAVVLGDDAMTRLDTRFVLERTIISADALLAADEDLSRRYVDLIADPGAGPETLVTFLNDLVGAAAGTTDDNLLGYADGLPQQRATLLGLFGLVSADPATSIVVDVSDESYADLEVPLPGYTRTATSRG